MTDRKAYNRQWRLDHLDEKRAYAREFGRTKFWFTAARFLRRRAKGAPCASAAELRDMWEATAGIDPLTLLPIKGVPHLDHMLPVSKGGGHTIDNLRWLDARTNRAKGDSTDEEFLEWWHSPRRVLQ